MRVVKRRRKIVKAKTKQKNKNCDVVEKYDCVLPEISRINVVDLKKCHQSNVSYHFLYIYILFFFLYAVTPCVFSQRMYEKKALKNTLMKIRQTLKITTK